MHPDHFTTASFRTIIKQVALGRSCNVEDSCRHVWLDIACINQNSSDDEMLDEIGRQASIFNRARDCFIWLNHKPASSLDWILRLWNMCFSRAFSDQIEGKTGAVFTKDWLAKHRAFFSDPWFTSMWTLQEALLRPDAILFSQEGGALEGPWGVEGHGDKELVCLNHLAGFCTKFCQVIESYMDEDDTTPNHRDIFDQVLRLLDEYGLRVIGDTNAVELYACSDNKKPLLLLDKIYGIQQVFGFSLGKASSLMKLEDRFAASLNQLNPIIGQAFVNTEEPPPGRSWRITPRIHVPINTLYILRQEPETGCDIRYDDLLNVATFHGPTSSFQDCVSFWKHAAESEDYNGGLDCIQLLHLDQTPSNRSRFPTSFFQTERLLSEELLWSMNDALLSAFGPQLCILRLGLSRNTDKQGLYKSIGIIAYASRNDNDDTGWVRIGFALWDVWSADEVKKESETFRQLQYPLLLS